MYILEFKSPSAVLPPLYVIGDIHKALEIGKNALLKLECDSVQVFTKKPTNNLIAVLNKLALIPMENEFVYG